MELSVKNQQGRTVDTITVNDAVFAVPMNESLVHQALVMYQANLRQGTHDTKTRAEVSGGGRKPWAQKHTGRARQGSIRAPQWRHGGVAFGPHPRDYRLDMPKRMRRLAMKCMLSEKARQGQLVCVDALEPAEGKTRAMAAILSSLGVAGPILVVTGAPDQQVVRAAHNLERVWTTPVNLLNAHDLLKYATVVMTVDAARRAEEMWSVEPHGHRGKAFEGTPMRLRVLQRRIKKTAAPAEATIESSDGAIATGEAPAAPARQRAPRRRLVAEPAAEPAAESGEAGSGVAE
ncbi:MAG: 50S ribosomal protein L4 [Dehalococcoidia bacterium]|nr:50S ribosomal protein L4 [Dehalococcoidia bacterium]MSQ15957.1 50S ribosomal protein L4 [Dehalococcoidia bacterium]